ncbi:hypothetical protein WL29_09360 [Burkholderia ubonensis]|uniref:Uncharacterized protein n=1 Tax=Burkholderia ubonensis TaxID=101571 RepID=A0A106PJC6_9BURK|nr:hypothetical protein WL29_09360 [Burkholderia ubonensis]
MVLAIALHLRPVGKNESQRFVIETLANWVRAAKAGKLKDVGRHQKPLTQVETERSWTFGTLIGTEPTAVTISRSGT